MHDQFRWQFLGILAGLKIITTTLSFVSGTPGGMFAPTLFIGAMLGGAIGGAERHFFPTLTVSTGTYALVGMGVLFAGFLRVPMTSVFMVLEVSGNYSIILPVIVANTFAYLVSRSLQPTPIFDLLTRQDGLVLPSLEEEREQTPLRVEDAMRPISPAAVLNAGDSVSIAVHALEGTAEPVFLVRMSPSGWNTVTREAIQMLAGEGKGDMSLGSTLPIRHLPYLYPDLPLEAALRYVNEMPLLPVVHRADLRQLEGIISRDEVFKKYQLAATDEPL
jgi:CIC family chloride channel protein